MATNLNTRIISRNDIASNWESANPILMKGEIGIEINTRKAKVGDGVKPWLELPYFNVRPEDLTGLGYGDMLKSVYDTNNNGKVDTAETAEKLKTPVTIAGVSFDGSANISITKTNVGLGNVDNTSDVNKPVSTAQASAIANAISDSEAKLGTAATKDVGVATGNVVVVESNGKINTSLIPSVAITDTFTAASEAAMLALSDAEKGDVCVRTDINKTFILRQNGYNILANWIELRTPTDTVVSVNGMIGSVVLTTTNIDEGSNKYYTEERVDANFITHSSTELKDSSSLIRATDVLILDGGNA